jgi:hypothetical protein
MPIIILLLVAILIILIGGPIALGVTAGAAVALPAWLIWSSGIFGTLFWVLVIGAGLVVIFIFANGFSKTPPVFPNSRECMKCGHRQPKDMRFCFKCSHEHSTAT